MVGVAKKVGFTSPAMMTKNFSSKGGRVLASEASSPFSTSSLSPPSSSRPLTWPESFQ